jgi:uncharacterized protein YecT (DUF1311 family)
MTIHRFWPAAVAAIALTGLARAEHALLKYECKGTQIEINHCAGTSWKLADDEMNALYRRKLDQLESRETRARLVTSQRAWLVFRDTTCLYEVGPREEPGTLWPLENFRCLEHHTRQRSRDLSDYLKCTMDGCPR